MCFDRIRARRVLNNAIKADRQRGRHSLDQPHPIGVPHCGDHLADRAIAHARACQKASKPGNGTVVEQVVPGADTPHFSKLLDVHMMIWGSGRERTAEEYAGLLKEAGWTFLKAWYPPSKMLGVVGAIKA